MELVYNNKTKKVILMFDAPDLQMRTGQTVFKGTLVDCQKTIETLKLILPEESPYLIERVFKDKTENIKNNSISIIKDGKTVEVLEGIKVKEEGGETYLKCTLSENIIKNIMKNTTEEDVNLKALQDSGFSSFFVCDSKTP